jgi:adenosylhomocysteine nucleosidase
MKFGIIAAMEEELKTLLLALEDKKEVVVLGKTYYKGRIGQHEVVLVQSGIGKVLSAMSVTILAETFGVDAIINTGSAGAVSEGLAIGDVVIADRLVYHDVDVTAFGYAYGQMAGQELYFWADSDLMAKLQAVLAQEGQESHLGLIATGDSFIADPDRVAAIKHHFPEVLAVEMEGAAIAQAAQAAGKPFLVIRAMSDTAQGDANITFDEFILEAGKRSAQTLLALLENY